MTKKTAESLSDYFEIHGHNTTQSFNDLDALKKFSLLEPDFVILSVNLPIYDDVSIFSQIKKINKDAQIIVMTLYALGSLPKEILDSAMMVMRKPFDFHLLKKLTNTSSIN